MYKSEILAPAGKLDAIIPLIEAGADAIYVGLSGFSSRPVSADFSIDEIQTALKLCHDNNTPLHVAINGCIQEKKLDEIKKLLIYLDEMGVDALILADWGLIFTAQSCISRSAIHASTLLGTYNAETVRFLKSIGVKRVVLSTNMYIDEIAAIVNSVEGIEYEIVAEGGICFNDNRMCELPHTGDRNGYSVYCRKCYELVYENERHRANPICADTISSKEILLMYLQLGIYSFKIEGRTADIKNMIPKVQNLKAKAEELKYRDNEDTSSLHYINRMRNRAKGHILC